MFNFEKRELEEQFYIRYHKLNEAQKKAVNAIDGPVMVVAGPGTGKTEILAMRIANILIKTDIRPFNILCLTFTEEGAANMRERLFHIIGTESYLINIHTFHSFCNHIIKKNESYFQLEEFEILNDLEANVLFREMIEELPNGHSLKPLKGDNLYRNIRFISDVFGIIQKESLSVEFFNLKCTEYLDSLPFREEFLYKVSNTKKGIKKGDKKSKAIDEETKKINKLLDAVALFPIYKKKLQAIKRYTFNDMIEKVVTCFSEENYVLAKYQEQFQYVLIDEYQDTNGSQNKIIDELMNFWDQTNIFVVGDEDQCIFRFQGANVLNMKNFINQYEQNIQTIFLSDNYRSTQPILNLATELININQERLTEFFPSMSDTKKLISQKKDSESLLPSLKIYLNEEQEIVGTIEDIKLLHQQGKAYHQMAILYSKNDTGKKLATILNKQNIPYQISKEINIFDEEIIKKIICILKYLYTEFEKPYSKNEYLYILLHYNFFNNTAKELGKAIIELKNLQAPPYSNSLRYYLVHYNSENNINGLNELEELLLLLPQQNISDFIISVLNKCQILKWISTQNENIWYFELIDSFINFIQLESKKNPTYSLKEMIENIIDIYTFENIPIPITQTITQKNGVFLKTCHAAKGKEYDTVFIINCTKKEWEKNPHKIKLPDTFFSGFQTSQEEEDKQKIEEKRRLFYVGISRAKQNLILSYSAQNNIENNEANACNFILEIKQNKNNLNIFYPQIPEKILLDYGLINLIEKQFFKIKGETFINQDYVNLKIKDLHLNASNLNTYLTCPLSFYFEIILQAPTQSNIYTVFGNCLHDILEKIYHFKQKDINQSIDSLENILNQWEKLLQKKEHLFTPYQFESNLKYGKQLLEKIFNQYLVFDTNSNFIIENKFKINLEEDLNLSGKLDKIELYDHTALIVDYKTGTYTKENVSPPSEKNPYGGTYWRQAVIYNLLMKQQTNIKTEIGGIQFIYFVYDNTNPQKAFDNYTIHPTQEDSQFVKNLLLDTWKKIKNFEFENGCGECIWCNLMKRNETK